MGAKAAPNNAAGNAQEPTPAQLSHHHPTELASALALGGHALLLHGPAGVGRLALARAYAAAAHCEAAHREAAHPDFASVPPALPCLACPACRSHMRGEHPDVLELRARQTTASGKQAMRPSISVKAINHARDEQNEYERHLNRFLEVRGSGRYRTVIVDGAEDLSAEAANAALKLIEEPPHGARFVFIARDLGGVLPTILSRATRLSVPPLSKTSMQQAFPELSETLLAFAAGRPALLARNAEGCQKALSDAEALLSSLPSLSEALKAAAALGQNFDPDLHPQALRFLLKEAPLKAQAQADKALAQALSDRESYLSSELLWSLLALELRLALGYSD